MFSNKKTGNKKLKKKKQFYPNTLLFDCIELMIIRYLPCDYLDCCLQSVDAAVDASIAAATAIKTESKLTTCLGLY